MTITKAVEEQGSLGWIVDDGSQVSPVSDGETNDPHTAEHYSNGLIDREEDEGFFGWLSPDIAFEDPSSVTSVCASTGLSAVPAFGPEGTTGMRRDDTLVQVNFSGTSYT